MKTEISKSSNTKGYYILRSQDMEEVLSYVKIQRNESIVYIKPGFEYVEKNPEFRSAIWIDENSLNEVIISNRSAVGYLRRR